MKFIFLLLLAAGLQACQETRNPQSAPTTFPAPTDTVPEASANETSSAQAPVETPAFPEASANAAYSYQLIPAENGTFGYEIKQNDRTLIRQTTIPAMPGNLGFASREDAGKVAELVISKLKNGEMPPTVSEAEMKKLEVIQ